MTKIQAFGLEHLQKLLKMTLNLYSNTGMRTNGLLTSIRTTIYYSGPTQTVIVSK